MIKLIDCTIRDGGHLNKWHFSPECIKASYFSAFKSGIEYFETGYRYPESIEKLGESGYCSDNYLFYLLQPSKECKITVMVDTDKYLTELFKECRPELTPVKAVRVAAYPYEIDKALGIVEELYEKGYEVFLNLMAVSEATEANFETLGQWQNKEYLQAIYFADSFGSFIPSDIPEYIRNLRELGFKNIGFHSHNNLQLAFANTIKAIEEGVEFVDASIYGMGRGAGNLPIEILLIYLQKKGYKYSPVSYIDVIERYYSEIYSKYDWGYKLETLIGGLKNIHPYYVSELFNRKTYTIDEIWNAADIIKENCPISFSPQKISTLVSKFSDTGR